MYYSDNIIFINNCFLFSDGPEALPKQYRGNVIYIHPSSMKLCDYHIGSPVIIDKQVVLFAWPSQSLPLTGAAVTQTVKQTGLLSPSKVIISQLLVPHLSATETLWKPGLVKLKKKKNMLSAQHLLLKT